MKKYFASSGIISTILLTIFLTTADVKVFGQDDEARQQSGLPTFIGNRPDSNPVMVNKATLSGSLLIQGIIDENSAPTFTISVYSNGTLVNRQRVKNRGAFVFNGVPLGGVTLIVEADNAEIASYPIGPLNAPPLSNRHDLILTWLQVDNRLKNRNETVSVKNLYDRSEDNQKLLEKANSSIKEKKPDNAVKLFKQILEKDANDFVVWTELGSAYFMQEKLSDAEKSYIKALALRSDFQPALLNLGKLYLHQKNHEKSIETLSNLVNLDSKSADANHYLGEAYLQARQGSKAVGYLNEAIKLAPVEKAEIHLRLAALYNAAGAKDRAVAEYKMFLEKVPGHPEKSKIEKYISENTSK